jgi:hypothetical protein
LTSDADSLYTRRDSSLRSLFDISKRDSVSDTTIPTTPEPIAEEAAAIVEAPEAEVVAVQEAATEAAPIEEEAAEATPATDAAPVVEPAPAPAPAPAPTPADDESMFGTFDEEGNYTPRQIVADDISDADLDAAYGQTFVSVEEGQMVNGTVVRIDADEVLLDIGYKSEGVIPARELSIRNDVDPREVVSMGESIESLVLTKEDKEGRLILSRKRAQYERAWGKIEQLKEEDGMVSGPVIEVVKGGLIVDIGLRGFLPASLVELRRVRDLQPYV